MILKQVIHYPDSNSVEATWVDSEDVQVRCHSYADVQMDMLREDLSDDAAEYAELIAMVEAGIKPADPVVIPPISVSPRQIRQALTAAGLRTSVEAAIAGNTQDIKDWYEFATTFEEDHPTVIVLAEYLLVSKEDLHNLFVLAASL